MESSNALMAADAALDELRAEAAYAEMTHGDALGASLFHYHSELTALLHRAFELQAQAKDLTLNKRMRLAYEAHAADIAKHIVQDAEAVRTKFETVLARGRVSKPGARGVFESIVGQSLTKAEIWWEGRVRLGKPTAAGIAARNSRSYKRVPVWLGWTAGAVVMTGAVAVPIITSLI